MQVKSFCPPSGLNGAAALVAQTMVPGQRAGTPLKHSNLDCSGLRVVRRGSVVEFPGGATARVARVRLGQFWPAGLGRMSFSDCRSVRVVA